MHYSTTVAFNFFAEVIVNSSTSYLLSTLHNEVITIIIPLERLQLALFTYLHRRVKNYCFRSFLFILIYLYTINERVNEDLKCLKIWLAGNKLSINVAKTNSLVIGSRKKLKDIQCPLTIKPSFARSGEEISIIEHTKYLGVQVDQYINWENHMNHLRKKISKALSMMRLAKTFSL